MQKTELINSSYKAAGTADSPIQEDNQDNRKIRERGSDLLENFGYQVFIIYQTSDPLTKNYTNLLKR